ncbi:MAG: endonuclease [Actinomycetota bacterium]|nr:endonuclease [Actinomycetota bacterium]
MAGGRKPEKVVAALIDRYGTTFVDEAGFVLRDTPSSLFRLLCLALLLSARIRSSVAVNAAKALAKHKWTTPERLLKSSWSERAKVLNQAGYARYDERTSTMLEESARLLLDRWDGDLRKLRREAERNPRRERQLLQQFKGIGEVGADIFCREAQALWEELRPFADRRALAAAERIGLPADPSRLARLVGQDDLSTVVAALIRLHLDKGYKSLVEAT